MPKANNKQTQKKSTLSQRKLSQKEIKKIMPSVVRSLQSNIGGNKASVELKSL